MTTAETNNEQATMDEFVATIANACNDAQDAGIPAESAFRALITMGISGAVASGIPLEGEHGIDAYVTHLLKTTKQALSGAEALDAVG